jgi:hypothetical protein
MGIGKQAKIINEHQLQAQFLAMMADHLATAPAT